MNEKEIELDNKLKAPFKPDEIEWRLSVTLKDKMKGLAVAYVTNRAIQNRLDEVLGAANWKNEFIVSDKTKICGLSIKINGEWITKYDGASDTDIEAVKGGLSGAMKRAAVQWGIGRYLYKLPSQWVKIKQQGKSYVIDEKPVLPNWALPESAKKTSTWKTKKTDVEKLPENTENCIKAFKGLGVSVADLENYLHLEAVMFTDDDIETLRAIYSAIYSGKKTKDDFFYFCDDKRSSGTKALEDSLS